MANESSSNREIIIETGGVGMKKTNNQWDGEDDRIVNVANPINDHDVVNKLFLEARMLVHDNVFKDGFTLVNDVDLIVDDSNQELMLENNPKTIFNISSQGKFDFVCEYVPYVSSPNDIKDTDQITTKGFVKLAIVDSKSVSKTYTDQKIGNLNQSILKTNQKILSPT